MQTIVALIPEHWNAVKDIYVQGIVTGLATFQTDAPSWEEWDKSHLPDLRFIALSGKTIAGWAALSPVSSRCVYAGVAEVSLYIHENFKGKGYGTLLLQQLIAESEQQGIWTLQSGIFRENEASIALHKKSGFREVGFREKIGKLHGQWRDTVLMERRSLVIE